MNDTRSLLMLIGMVASASGTAPSKFETDIITTSAGDLAITFIGHATLMFQFNALTIHVDPFSMVADYSSLPKADMVLITHEHFDHLDLDALAHVRGDKTVVVLTQTCAPKVPDGVVMKNGDVQTLLGIKIEAVPAYNVVHMRDDRNPFHPKGVGNGYILTFGDKRIYVAGDTENIPEMNTLEDISVAFLPMNQPYTMTPEMAADAARRVRPDVLYPYHFGDTDTSQLTDLLKAEAKIEVRIRSLS